MSTTPDLLTPRDSTPTGVFADAAGSPTLTWSDDLPAVAGWWWAENDNGRFILEIHEHTLTGDFGYCDTEKFHAIPDGMRWAGPLPEPHEPSPVEPSGNVLLTDDDEQPAPSTRAINPKGLNP